MALFRKFFYKKPPDGLLEITERVYVFDYCFTTDVMDEDEYKVYIGGIIRQIGEHFPDASFMVFNMREGENQSHISSILCDYDMTVMDYPRQYEGCPLLTMEMIHHFLRSGENWLQLGQQNVVLMHCERGGWPVLAFMLAALLIYRKMYTGEQKTLDMIYKQAPRELLQLMSPLNPLPSQLRYLQYISRRNVGSEWPPLDRALTLDCVIIRHIPNMDGEGGCRPIFRIYGQDPFIPANRTPKVLFSTPKKSKLVRHYKQADCELVKIDIHCHVQGDVVLECISLEGDLEREQMMFRVMFNTAFIRSNILMLNRDEIDMLWNAKDHFPKDFRVEVLFSDMEASSSSVISIDLPRIEEKEGLPVEAFAKVKEIFSQVEWLDSKSDVANMLQQITASNIILERLDSGGLASPTALLNESLSGRFKFDSKTPNETDNLKSSFHEELPLSPLRSSEDVPMKKMIEPLKIEELSEEKIETLASLGQASKPIPSFDLSKDSDSTKVETESSESKQSLENYPKFPASTAQLEQSVPLIEPSIDADSMKKKTGSLESEEKKIESLASKAVLENDTMFPASDSSTKANSVKSIGLLGSKEKEIESLDSKALLENDSGVKSKPKMRPEAEIRSPSSAGQEKFSASSFESIGDATMEKKKKPSDLTASPENNIKIPAPADSNSTAMKIESLESKAPVENDTKFPTSTAQAKQSTPSIKPSTEANSVKQSMEQLESKKKDIESIESKSLENDTKGKQSVPLIQTSVDASSMKTMNEKSESTALSENDTKSPTSEVDKKQISPSLEPTVDEKSIKKKIDSQELQVSLQLPTQSKIISPRIHQANRSATASYSSNSSLGSPVGSALGITSVLQDHAPKDIKEDVTHAVSISPPSDSKVPKSVETCSTSIPTTSSTPALLPSSPLKSSADPPDAVEKTSKPLAPIPPPPPPPQQEPTSKLMQSTITQHGENSMHDKKQISSAIPPPPPPPSLPETSLSTIKDSSKSPSCLPPPPPPPPPPSSTGQTSSSSIPPPPLPPPQSMNNSVAMPGPPPPPPPPSQPGTTPGSTSTQFVPPPPPPPASATQNSLSKSSPNVPPVPPPPSANGLAKPGTATPQPPGIPGPPQPPAIPGPPGNAPPVPGPPGNVPPIPGPPSGAFGAKGRGLLRTTAKTQTKRSNLKPYHWLKLTRAMQGSLWAETQKLDEASRAPEFDMSELETLFSAATPSNNNEKGGNSNRRGSAQKPDKVQLIELRRAYNCEIMLTKVKIPLPDLMGHVLALDDSVLYVDQVENLIKFCPTKEEMDQLKAYTGDKDNLGKCEQFFLELMKVPRVESKLRVFCFKMQFCSQVLELKRDLNIVNSASEEIRNSVKLKRIMQTILSLGNALNHGTARGAAVGFRLDSLLKLTDTRARNNKMTLMHYLCKVLSEKLPELLDFHKDLVNLEASTKIQLKFLAEEMQAISKGLEKVIQELTASENDGPVSETFCQILKEFLSDAEAEVRSLAQLYANVGRNADALASYFGEDPARCPFEQVVTTLLNFVRMFIRAHDENCKQIEYDKKKAEKEAAAENEKLKLAAKNDSPRMMRTTIKSGDIK
ncbi:formin protein [Trifolium repens]|nr:formin protein [Trifolium repens]